MSKLANILKMIVLLKSRRKMQIKELAEELEVNERMIRKYKDDLEQAGIFIVSKSGANGGYSLASDYSLFNSELSKEELAVLEMGKKQLEMNGFMFLKEYNSALEKMDSSLKFIQNDINQRESLIISSRPNIDLKVERKKYLDIYGAILSSKKIKMRYFSLHSGLNERIVRPYTIFLYNEFWYFIGFCEFRNEIREFKLPRIKSYEIIDENFDRPLNFSLNEYMKNGIGIRHDKSYKVKLKIFYPLSIIINERIYVDNQKITFNDDNSIIFEAIMTGMEDIKSWILSMGSNVVVIEPIELKNELKEEIIKMQNMN